MRRDRLLRLIEVLEQVKQDGRPFDMGRWVGSGSDTTVGLLDIPVEECGTASCAFGWAARDPVHRAQGIELKWHSQMLMWVPEFAGRMGFAAAETFYEITERQAIWLFDPPSYAAADKSIAHVLARVRVLAGEAAP